MGSSSQLFCCSRPPALDELDDGSRGLIGSQLDIGELVALQVLLECGLEEARAHAVDVVGIHE